MRRLLPLFGKRLCIHQCLSTEILHPIRGLNRSAPLIGSTQIVAHKLPMVHQDNGPGCCGSNLAVVCGKRQNRGCHRICHTKSGELESTDHLRAKFETAPNYANLGQLESAGGAFFSDIRSDGFLRPYRILLTLMPFKLRSSFSQPAITPPKRT